MGAQYSDRAYVNIIVDIEVSTQRRQSSLNATGPDICI